MPSAAIPGIGPAPAMKPARNLGEMSPEHFLQLLITQLQNQDPFEPVKNQDLLNQISAVRQLQTNMDLSKTLGSLALQQQIGSAGNLIGKAVEGFNGAMERVWGLVTSATVEEDEVYLNLDNGQRVALKDLIHVWQPTASEGGTETDGGQNDGEQTNASGESEAAE